MQINYKSGKMLCFAGLFVFYHL
ncbi:MAG: KxYKxGKxW signal peptide domain-containing protein [Clostridia bacterium]|nr:KxYKxGKxW signal peptide domain-containing protein [Clostridia bacterium]